MLIFENNMANLRRRDFLKIGLGAGAAAVIKPKIASAGKNDLSVLENKLNEFGIFNGDKRKPFLDKFDYSKDYEQLHQRIAYQIATLDCIEYSRLKTLGEFKWYKGRFNFFFSNEFKGKNRLLIGFEDKIWLNLDEKGDYIIYSKYEYLYKTNKAPRNQLLYLAYTIAESFYKDILAYNNEWKNMPWRKIISNKYKENFGFIKEVLPYDESKGEFVFFGMDWCEPCKKVAKILIDNKIKFREEESDTGAVPRIYYQNKVIDKADGIIDKIREMYGLSKSELIKIFRNY